MPSIHGFCSFFSFGAMRGKPLIAPYGPVLGFYSLPLLFIRRNLSMVPPYGLGYGASDLGISDFSANSQPLGSQSCCESKG